MIENSIAYSILRKIGSYFMSSIKNSSLVQLFLTDSQNESHVESSLIFKLYSFIRKMFLNLFNTLKLDRLFHKSIFKINFLWMLVTVALAPFAPTMMALLMSIAGFLSMGLKLCCERKFSLQYNHINKYIYVYILIYVISILASVNRSSSLYGGLVTICFVLFSIVVINSIKTKSQVAIINFLLVSGGAVVSLYGFYQYLNPRNFGGSWVDQDMFDGMFRVYSTFQNPNVLGEYFLLIIPLGVACFFLSKHLLLKLFYLGCVGAMMLCLVLTYSRGCYLGIMVAAAIFAVLMDKRFIVLGVIALILLPFVLPETILNRFLSIGNMEDTSTSYRVYIWMGTIAMLKDYWFSGIGPGEGAYNILYPIYAYSGISAPHAHNTFLQVMCDTGIMGVLTFICILFRYYKSLFISYVNSMDKTERILTISGISAMSGFLIQSLFDYTFYNYRVTLLFWVFVGLGVVYSQYSKLKEV